MVECLLDFGADPNFAISKFDLQSPWIVALTKVTLLHTIQSKVGSFAEYFLAEDKWKQTLRLMFSRGADCTKVPGGGCSRSDSRQLESAEFGSDHLRGGG